MRALKFSVWMFLVLCLLACLVLGVVQVLNAFFTNKFSDFLVGLAGFVLAYAVTWVGEACEDWMLR